MQFKAAVIPLSMKIAPKLFSFGAKLIKSAKVIKFAMAGASFASYAWLYSWEFSCLIIVALVWHEYGHLLAMQKLGIPTKGIYLIPFVGGAAVSEGDLGTRTDEFFIAIAGPVFGLLSVFALMLLYLVTGYPLWAGCAAWVAIFNLINLLPINPLDGGRMVKSITFSLHSKLALIMMALGILCGAILIGMFGAWLIGLIIFVGLADFVMDWRNRETRPCMSLLSGSIGAVAYIGLALLLIWMIHLGHSVPEAQAALEALKD